MGAAPAAAGLAGSPSRLLALVRTPLYTNAFCLWVNVAGTALAGLAFWAVVARLYSADDVGSGAAALSILALLATFSHLGLGLGLMRFLPESGESGSRLINGVFTAGAAAAVVSSVVFLAGVRVWAPGLDFLVQQPLYSLAFVSFVVFTTLWVVQGTVFVAIRKGRYILVQFLMTQITRLALVVLMATVFGAFGIVASLGMATTLGVVAGFAFLARGLAGYRPAGLFDSADISKLLPFSVVNHVADLLLLAPGLVLPLLVMNLLGSTDAAYFYIAWFLGYLLISASASLALSLLAEGSRDPGALRVLSRNAVAAGLVVATVGTAFLLLLADRVLLVFGPDYATEGATLTRIVALTAVPAALLNVYLGALRVTKRLGELVAIAGAVAVTTVALSYALLPVVGLTGAGIGHGIGQGLGLTIVLTRLLPSLWGTARQRLHWLLLR